MAEEKKAWYTIIINEDNIRIIDAKKHPKYESKSNRFIYCFGKDSIDTTQLAEWVYSYIAKNTDRQNYNYSRDYHNTLVEKALAKYASYFELTKFRMKDLP
jgi:hypothetical protein